MKSKEKVMKELKKSVSGITLISLVITIIILMIIAGVSINLTIGDNGLFSRAKEAKKLYQKEAVVEEISLKILEQQSKGMNISKSNLKAILSQYGTVKEENGQIMYVVQEDGSIIEIQEVYTGTVIEDNITYIYTKEQLEEFKDSVKNGNTYENQTVMLMNDIDLKCDEDNLWDGIGTEENKFSGTFDGNNCTVYNVSIVGNNSGIYGFFNHILNSTIKNLTVEGETKSTISDLKISIGGIVSCAYEECTIDNCCNKINIEKEQDIWSVGGIVADTWVGSYVTIKNCRNESKISGGNNAAGIVGIARGKTVLENCYNSGTIENFKGENVGGLIARGEEKNTESIIIKNCYNKGMIRGRLFCGGAIGALPDGHILIDNFYNIGDIIQYGTSNVDGYAYPGGCIGKAFMKSTGTVINCYNMAKINSQDFIAAGLVCETCSSDFKIINSYNYGEIEAKTRAGGIAGYVSKSNNPEHQMSIEIENCIQAGKLIGDNGKIAIIRRNMPEATIKVNKTYYLDTTADVSVECPDSNTEDNSTSITEEYLKSQQLVDELNKYVEENKVYKIDDNTSVELLKWKIGENGYPVFE